MSLAGIVGNRALIDGLEAELARRPAHAYLLAGPRGIGKSLIAVGLAHSIVCERSPGKEFCCAPENCPVRRAAASTARSRANAPAMPRCDCCAGCVQVASGVHPDFIYIARNPGRTEVLIEQVRDLIERLGGRPARARRRVAVVDDAETLNIPAQNALLKTIEEPPGETIIFLVTQSERALLDTIRSRMRPVRFGPLDSGEIAGFLMKRIGIAADQAASVASLSRGSVDRALALSEGAEPPIGQLVAALERADKLDFADAQFLAQDLFGSREEAGDNFELIARIIEEMLCFKLLQTKFNAPSPEVARSMARIAQKSSTSILADLLEGAVKAREAIDSMANSRLQAEHWWMTAAAAMRGE
jgi:DNA polymerase III subunit delta'